MKENLESRKSTPILVSKFLNIRERPEINPTINDFSGVFKDKKYREHCFKEVKSSFEFIFDKKKLLHHLQKNPNKESISYLKQVRRYGVILRGMYRFLDPSHKCGEGLDQLLLFLGEYNDNYWLSPSEEIKKGIINNLNDIEFSINFIDTLGFKEYAKSLLFKIEEQLKEKILSVDKFHTLRIRLRLFADLMQVTAAENYGGNLHWLFYSIIELSSEMGKHHDDLIQKGLNGEINYHKSTVRINPRIASEFKRIKPFIEKVCGLI